MNLYLPLATRHLPLTKFGFSIVLCLLSCVCFSQTWNWAKGEGDIGSDAANSITLDENGNAYITGNIAGKADFSGTVYQGRGIYDVFIAKYDPQGNLLWVKTAGGDKNDQGNAIRYRQNFIYVTGYFSGAASFESNVLTSRGEGDMFVAKYDLSGNLIWVKQAGGTNNDYGSSIDVDLSGNVFVGGTYEYAATFDVVQLSTANIYNESFFAKYNSAGNLTWAKSSVGNNFNMITGVAFDNHNSIFLTGYFGGSFQIGNSSVNSSTSSYDIFLAKIDGNGNVEWLNRAGSNYEDAAHGVCSDMNGNPSMVGYFAGTAYFGSNSVTYHDYNDIFVAHYDGQGNNLWVRAGKGLQLDVGFAIAADDQGNVFATGMFQSAINFDGDSLTGIGKEIFVISYSPNGDIRWITQAGLTGTDCGLGIAVGNSDVVAVCGYYLLNCTFGTIQIDYAQAVDLFIAEFNPPIANSIKETGESTLVSLFPNPCYETTVCRVSLQNSEETVIKIFDVLGNEILRDKFHSFFNIQTNFLSPGLYFVEVSSRLKKQTLKLVKQ